MALKEPFRDRTLVPRPRPRLYQVAGIAFNQKPSDRQQRSQARASAILSSLLSATPGIAGRARISLVLFALSRSDARASASSQIGSAHVCTPVTHAHLVCRL